MCHLLYFDLIQPSNRLNIRVSKMSLFVHSFIHLTPLLSHGQTNENLSTLGSRAQTTRAGY